MTVCSVIHKQLGANLARLCHQYGVILKSVNSRRGSKEAPLGERLETLLEVFSPWNGISLTYRQFAAEIGKPVTEAAVKKWPRRKKFPSDMARLIVNRAKDRGLLGVTLEWVLWGDGPRPQKATETTPSRSMERGTDLGLPMTTPEPHGHLAVRIGEIGRASCRERV